MVAVVRQGYPCLKPKAREKLYHQTSLLFDKGFAVAKGAAPMAYGTIMV
jgi:hypothetical protein